MTEGINRGLAHTEMAASGDRSIMPQSRHASSFWIALSMLIVFPIAFAIYVHTEKQLIQVSEQRFRAHSLAVELKQSLDDTWRMARTYISTGDPVYKRYYQEILDIRDGKLARPLDYDTIYWDLVLSDRKSTLASTGQTSSLLEMLGQTNVTADEFAQINLALQRARTLEHIEREAIRLYDSNLANKAELAQAAHASLNDGAYQKVKAQVMLPIAEFHRMMETRIADDVKRSASIAIHLRIFFIGLSAVLLFVLWRAYLNLRFTLGAAVPQIRLLLNRLGRGDFSESIVVPGGAEHSVLGLLSLAQQALARIDTQRRDAEIRNQRLTQFYTVLSQCNKAIVRSRTEEELFQQICRDTVQYAGIKMAWVSVLDLEAHHIKAIAAEGEGTQAVTTSVFSMQDIANFENESFYAAIRDGRPYWCQDMMDETIATTWHDLGSRFGWQAAASIPLFRSGAIYGSFNLYAGTAYAFDEEIQTLLVELAMDLSFALNRFELEASRQRSRQLDAVRSFMLERINSATPIDLFFDDVAQYIESIIPKSMCSILLMDKEGQHVRIASARSLPPEFHEVVEGMEVAEGVGACVHAMFTGQRTIIDDTMTHPNWAKLRPLAEQLKVKACWSQPIRSSSNPILGAVAVYFESSTKVEHAYLVLLEMVAHFLAIAIEKHQAQDNLNKLSQAVEQSPNSIIITDADAHIEYVNAAFMTKTGRSMQEVLGQRPSIMQSGKTPLLTYEEMWEALRHGDHWEGEVINRHVDGTEYTELAHISPVRDVNGEITHFLSVQEDITDKRITEERIQYLAHYDVLTGLPNRALLDERARFSITSAKRGNASLGMIFLDLDHFKNINDSLGHSTGDALLVELAKRLRETLREGDTISRLGGDEFIFLLPNVDEMGAEKVAEKLLYAVNQPFQFGRYDLNVSASMGIAVFPDDGEDLESLLKNADTAMYRAKKDGRNRFRFFTQEMQARSGRHLELVNALRHALERNEFRILYQPQINLLTGEVIGTEALLRWIHPELGSVSAAEFIPVAEETGLILQIGEWVLQNAVQQTRLWHDMGWTNLGIAVNLSVIQFRHSDLPGTVSQILQEAGLAPQFLDLELTEGVAMVDPPGAIAIMKDLNDRGIRISIDDFGTGYSSLSYLKKFRVSKLKIDQSFVRDINSDPEDRAIVSAVISMAHSLGLSTIAEGVENSAQLQFLRDKACDEVQGFYFSKALSPDEFCVFMQTPVNTQVAQGHAQNHPPSHLHAVPMDNDLIAKTDSNIATSL